MIINKDNINEPLEEDKRFLINEAFLFGDISIILYFKSLGAKLNETCANCVNTIAGALVYFDMGGEMDNNHLNPRVSAAPFESMLRRREFLVIYFLLEYGIDPPMEWGQNNLEDHIICNNYISTRIVPRITASRKALAALIICCKQRTHQGTLVFGAVRDVMFALAREMWAQKGPADKCCGPRSALWAKKPL